MLGFLPSSSWYSKTFTKLINSEVLKTKIPKRLTIEELKNREIIKVEGDESVPFLQGLMTNDMNHIVETRQSGHGAPSMFAMFLNKSGRLLYDTIIYRAPKPNTYLIECDKSVSMELQKYLRAFRVRRKVDIDQVKDYKTWAIFDTECKVNSNGIVKRLGADTIYSSDPRVRSLGWRMLANAQLEWNDVKKVFAKPGEIIVDSPTKECNYKYHRYFYGVAEGVEELPPGKCIPLEMNGDYLHGISFQKGCYIGQELTARAYHTGVIRKRLMPLLLSTAVPDDIKTVQSETYVNIGTLRGKCRDRALALLRLEHVLKASKLLIDGEQCFFQKPEWWPKELPNKKSLQEKA